MPEQPSLPPASNHRITLPDGTEILIPPLTVAAARRALALYPAEGAAVEGDLARVQRLRAEADILLGAANDGAAGDLPPLDAQDAINQLWADACGFVPAPQAWPSLGTPLPTYAPDRPAAYLVAALDRLAAHLRAQFPPLAQQLDGLPVSSALRMSSQLAQQSDNRN